MGLVAIVLLAAVGGCGGDGDGDDPPDPTPATTTSSVRPTIALTPTTPEVRLAPTVAGAPEVLDLLIGPVVNPTRAGFRVRVELETVDGGRSTYGLGEVSTFPVDAPGQFALRLPDEAVRQLTSGDRSATVVLRLEPVAADMPLAESIRLVVASARLRPA